MGIFLNSGNINFQESLNSEIYVDKTGLIAEVNKVIRTEQKYICVSHPRRFEKSMAANILVAYYCRYCDSKEMFSNYKIAKHKTFEKYLNNTMLFISIWRFSLPKIRQSKKVLRICR